LKISDSFAVYLKKFKYCQEINSDNRFKNINPMNKKSAINSSILMLLLYILSFGSLSATSIEKPSSSFSEDEMKWKVMNLGKDIDFKYTPEVRKYIKIYTKRGRKSSELILGKVPVYFPVFEKILEEKNLPPELKVLAIVESHLNVDAYSKAGAAGLWQFIKGTAKKYKLKVHSNFDERYDVEQSTRAALNFLDDLHTEFGDWTLALAAYNCGAGNVRKAIRRSGGIKNFWSIKRFLPRETRNYVPKFIAISFMLEHYKDYNLLPEAPDKLFFSTAEAKIYKHLNFRQISDVTGVPLSIIKKMNGAYRRNYIPLNTHGYKLVLPKNALFTLLDFERYKNVEFVKENKFDYSRYLAGKFSRETTAYLLGTGYRMEISQMNPIKMQILFRNSLARRKPEFIMPKPELMKIRNSSTLFYVLKAGETLDDVALNYENVSVIDIMHWNNINIKNPPRIGTKLIIKK